jgi:hypothetical protein
MKYLFGLLIGLMLSTPGSAQQVPAGFDLSNHGVRIEPDKRVMAVLATLEAARTTNEAGETVPVLKAPLSPEGAKFRELLRSDLANLDKDLRERISLFVVQHKRRNPNKTDAQITASFISMAHALTPVPELADPVVRGDLPGSLLDVLDFAPLVRDFYRSSTFAANLPEYVKTYQNAADGSLRRSAGEMVTDLLSYLQTRPQLYYIEAVRTETAKAGSKKTTLRTTERRERERRFFIVPEMLAPVGNVIFLNVKDDYFAIVSPESDLLSSEVRRAYLQFVIDPLVLNSSKDIALIRDGLKKLLDEHRAKDPQVSPDVYLTISRSLVAAIDAKQTEALRVRFATDAARQRIATKKTESERLAVSAELERYKQAQADETALRLSEDYDRGALLAFYFAEQLKGIEDSGFNIASSMREMILSFDPAQEAGRYERYADARERAVKARQQRRESPAEVLVPENPVTTRLLKIDAAINAKELAKAASELKTLLADNPSDPRIYYTNGRVASLRAAEVESDATKQRELLLEAKVAYENVIRIASVQKTDAALVSLTYVALAKIYEFYGDSTYAAGVYDAAIKIGPVTGGAYNEALAAKARLIRDQ